METKINMSELNVIDVNARLFFNYLAIKLNNLDIAKELEIGDFYNLLVDIKNDKYKNILADFLVCNKVSYLINYCYFLYTYTKYDNLTLIYDCEKILINIKFRGSIISLIITDFCENYSILKFIDDFFEL